jgi:hypothetical protein
MVLEMAVIPHGARSGGEGVRARPALTYEASSVSSAVASSSELNVRR